MQLLISIVKEGSHTAQLFTNENITEYNMTDYLHYMLQRPRPQTLFKHVQFVHQSNYHGGVTGRIEQKSTQRNELRLETNSDGKYNLHFLNEGVPE